MTGIGGFAGSHLAEHLLEAGFDTSGTLSPQGSAANLGQLQEHCHLYRLDLTQYDDVRAMLDSAAPDIIYHLAARASVPAAWRDPAAVLHNNIISQLNMLRAVAESGARPRMLIVGSSDEYGRVSPEDLPVDEDTPLRPVNPYAVSKLSQDYLGLQYHMSHGLPIVRVRPFNHTGPRQERGFLVPDLASQIAAIETGSQQAVLQVGDTSAERDFGDVRDTVRAYHLAATKGRVGAVYNIGTGRATAVSTILQTLLDLSRVPIEVTLDPRRLRPSDVPRIVADARRLYHDTGWEPRIPLERTLADTLNDWRARSQRGTD
ncbi:MAG: GDP-mannose 4,6-dehydratase [Anaerolineae bacterium]